MRRLVNLNKSSSVITLLHNMMDRVHYGNGTRDKAIKFVELLYYIINNFYKIKHALMNVTPSHVSCAWQQLTLSLIKPDKVCDLNVQRRTPNTCEGFFKALHNKIPEIVKDCEELASKGEKIKKSMRKIRRYQRIYNQMYFEFEEQMILEKRSQTIMSMIEKKGKVVKQRCQEMKKYIKHYYINQLNLCSDVLETIKSYCFYNKKTYVEIQFIRELRRQVVFLIDFAHSSRQDSEDECWIFYIEDECDFQCANCKICGNYWSTYLITPQNIICVCE